MAPLRRVASKVFNSPIKVLGSEKSQPLNTTISVIAVGVFTLLSLGAYGVYAIDYHRNRKMQKINAKKLNEQELINEQDKISNAIKGNDITTAQTAIDEAFKRFPNMKLEEIPDEMPGGILFYCLVDEKPEMLRLLIENGANPEHTGRMGTLLETAAIRGDAVMVETLVKVGANINSSVGKAPLRWAAEFGLRGTGAAENPDYCAVLNVLLDQDEVNVNDDDSPSLLYLVARQCENNSDAIEIFDLLIEKGAHLNDDDMESTIAKKQTPNNDFVERFLKDRHLLPS